MERGRPGNGDKDNMSEGVPDLFSYGWRDHALAEHDPVTPMHGGYKDLDVVAGAEHILRQHGQRFHRFIEVTKKILGYACDAGPHISGYHPGFTPSPDQCADITSTRQPGENGQEGR